MAATAFKPKPIICAACDAKTKPVVRGRVATLPRTWVQVKGPSPFYAVYCSEGCARTAFTPKALG